MRVVILVPRRGDGGRRDELWCFVEGWLRRHHRDWMIYEGDSEPGTFNRGAARNNAARSAGEWDVAVFHDADNISDPQMLEAAVRRAHETGGCVFPYSAYMYLDQFSSDRLMQEGNFFVAPQTEDWAVMHDHASGVMALSRKAYDQVGGFAELRGWGYEDDVMAVMLRTFTAGIEYMQGSAMHLWHPRGLTVDPTCEIYAAINAEVRDKVRALQGKPDELRKYMASGGHLVPNTTERLY
ncbi:galactosyltransferase-related protein [Mycolicibacter kumamotonensis]|uniref:Galactosyltransferase C-terminal domain-containing protein n=1 Tax=Mycolicibacter kumamotonensis TaxID=354243 RepID=A0A1B8SL72_9MYCO|nr:galactosyltransferase-related protein [Mycolicibacter kumamotonensis]OBY33478.1 hypothetical protein ACT18_00580 [Mycolicibacter kumamotonensis]